MHKERRRENTSRQAVAALEAQQHLPVVELVLVPVLELELQPLLDSTMHMMVFEC